VVSGEIVEFDRAKIGDQAQTWKRADGEMIMGDYSFMTGPDGLDDPYYDPVEYVVQTWRLVAEHVVLIPEPREPDPEEGE
jgi:hypothetical protein